MRKILLAAAAAVLLAGLAIGATTVTKGLIGQEDHSFGPATSTFTRATSTGATLTMKKIPRYWDNNAFTDNLALFGESVTGDGTGNISGYDNATFTGRVTTATLTVSGTPTFTDNTINGADLIDNTVSVGKVLATGTASASVFLRGDGAWASASSAVTSMAGYANLKITTPADNQSVTVTADKVAAVDTNDVPRVLSTVSLTIALDASGANGLDNGSLAANTGYYLYVIDNGATTAGLASTSATAPTMPSGYTYKALVGWCTTDNTTTPFNIEEFTQVDDVFRWDTKAKVLNDGGSTTTTALDLSSGGILGYAAVPPTITKGVFGSVRSNNTSGAGNNVFISATTFANALSVDDGGVVDFQVYAYGGTGGTASFGFILPVLVEEQVFYHQTSTVTMDVWIAGFTLKQ